MTNITVAETKVAALVAQGASNRQIAEELNIKVATVKFHCTNIYKKAEVKSRAEFIVKMLRATP